MARVACVAATLHEPPGEFAFPGPEVLGVAAKVVLTVLTSIVGCVAGTFVDR